MSQTMPIEGGSFDIKDQYSKLKTGAASLARRPATYIMSSLAGVLLYSANTAETATKHTHTTINSLSNVLDRNTPPINHVPLTSDEIEWYCGYDEELEGQDSIDDVDIMDETLSKLFNNQAIDKKRIDKPRYDFRTKRYLGNDQNRNENKNGVELRRNVIQGFERMIEDGDLDDIMRLCDKNEVPYDAVFLALTESARDRFVESPAGALGPRQFTEFSGELFGIVVLENGKRVDYRTDVEKSTGAAMQHLVENIGRAKIVHRKNGLSMNKSDLRATAFHRYNASYDIVREGIIGAKGKGRSYADHCTNAESRNYVPRMVAIREVLQDMYEDGDLMYTKNPGRTKADRLFQGYRREKEMFLYREKIQILRHIEKEYKKLVKQGQATQQYYDKAFAKLNQERKEINKGSDFAPNIMDLTTDTMQIVS